MKSEQLLRLCVDDSQIGPEISTEMERMKVEFVRDLLGTVGSQSSETATNNLLLGFFIYFFWCWCGLIFDTYFLKDWILPQPGSFSRSLKHPIDFQIPDAEVQYLHQHRA